MKDLEADHNARDLALAYLERLTPDQWARVLALYQRHKTGQLSRDAWQCATAAALEGKPGRVVMEGE